MNAAYIYDAVRTPRGRGRVGGSLSALSPSELLTVLYRALERRVALNPAHVEEVILGCVTQHGEQAGNVAKASALFAGWPSQISGITVNRFCSSGLDAANFASMKVALGQDALVIAGGVEMMSRVPMLSDKAAIFTDPKLAVRSRILMMGSGADLIASLYDVSRQQADALALGSQRRAAAARETGRFTSIVPVHDDAGALLLAEDECIRPDVSLEQLESLEPAFSKLGAQGVDALQLAAYASLDEIRHIHTAGNSPAMADGAALIMIGNELMQSKLKRAPRARIVDAANASDDPLMVLTGAIAATEKLMQRNQLSVEEVDLFEIHEAFAATIIKCQADLGIPDEKLNVNGGVIALGHPMGATGAMLLGTLLDEMERRNLKRGIVAASGAAGSGSAMLLER